VSLFRERFAVTKPFAWILFGKLVYLAVLGISLHFWGSTKNFESGQLRWPTSGPPEFVSHFAAWDGAHYLRIATHGYSAGEASCAFYPLWPFAVGLGAKMGLPAAWFSLVLANVLSALGLALFFWHVSRHWGTHVARWSLGLLLTYPGSLFLHVPYSEGMFFLALMVAWIGLESMRPGQAVVGLVSLPLIRGSGAFVAFPAAMYLLANAGSLGLLFRRLARWGLVGPEFWHLREAPSEGRPSIGERLIMLLAPVIGWGCYLGVMAWCTGNPWEGIKAQKIWGHRHSLGNLVDPTKFLVQLFQPSQWHEFAGSTLDRACFLGFCATIPYCASRMRWALWWILTLALLPAMSGSFTSFTRYGCCVFPCFLAAGRLIVEARVAWIGYLVMAVGALLQCVLLWRFACMGWAG